MPHHVPRSHVTNAAQDAQSCADTYVRMDGGGELGKCHFAPLRPEIMWSITGGHFYQPARVGFLRIYQHNDGYNSVTSNGNPMVHNTRIRTRPQTAGWNWNW